MIFARCFVSSTMEPNQSCSEWIMLLTKILQSAEIEMTLQKALDNHKFYSHIYFLRSAFINIYHTEVFVYVEHQNKS